MKLAKHYFGLTNLSSENNDRIKPVVAHVHSTDVSPAQFMGPRSKRNETPAGETEITLRLNHDNCFKLRKRSPRALFQLHTDNFDVRVLN